jgi:acyl-lipid omega-6 desaturase (Delta-12 desaturase)
MEKKTLSQRYMRDRIYLHISKYATPSDIRGGVEFLGTFGVWVALFWMPWWFLPLQALVLTRLFVVGVHDTGHMTLFRTRTFNDYALRITAPVVWMPGLSVWRPGHNFHHSHSNDLDYDQGSQTAPLTVTDYRKMSWWKRAVYRYATTPWVLLSQTAPLGMTLGQLIQIATWDEGLLQAAMILLMAWYGVLWRHVLVTFCSGSFGVFLFHLQHTFPECVRMKGRDLFENGYYGSSYLVLPEVLKLFTAGIEYHHIHHLSSRVPSYRLRTCHEEAPLGMWDGIQTMTVRKGWDALQLTLWSDVKEKLVSFTELDKEILLA